MSETNNNGTESGPGAPGWEVEVPVQELDQSCRTPVLFLLGKAAGWLFLGTLLAFFNSVRLHAPDLLAHCPWLTYGRIGPAASTALIYGFALQAAFAVAIWLVVRMSKSVLVLPGYLTIAAGFWNLGVFVGIVGILAGDATSYALFEIPKYATPILFVAYSIIGGLTLVTFQRRQVQDLYVSQWFLLTALLWFPWILSTAALLLQYYPVRGVVQVVVAGWYATGLMTLVLGGVGLASIFYLLPKLLKRSLHSHYLAVFAFWLLVFFGSGAGILSGSTVPAWISGLSAAFTFFACFATVLVALNWYETIGGQFGRLFDDDFRFLTVGMISFILHGVLSALNAHSGIAEFTQFSLVIPAIQQLALVGFVSMSLFALAYHLLPRLLGSATLNRGLINGHFWLTLVGLLLTAGILGLGGLIQGQTMNDASVPFSAVTKSALNFMRIETVGSLLLLAGACLFLLNVSRSVCQALCCGEGGLLCCLQGNVSGGDGERAAIASVADDQSTASAAAKKAPRKVSKKAPAKKKAAKKVTVAKKKQAKKAAKKS